MPPVKDVRPAEQLAGALSGPLSGPLSGCPADFAISQAEGRSGLSLMSPPVRTPHQLLADIRTANTEISRLLLQAERATLSTTLNTNVLNCHAAFLLSKIVAQIVAKINAADFINMPKLHQLIAAQIQHRDLTTLRLMANKLGPSHTNWSHASLPDVTMSQAGYHARQQVHTLLKFGTINDTMSADDKYTVLKQLYYIGPNYKKLNKKKFKDIFLTDHIIIDQKIENISILLNNSVSNSEIKACICLIFDSNQKDNQFVLDQRR